LSHNLLPLDTFKKMDLSQVSAQVGGVDENFMANKTLIHLLAPLQLGYAVVVRLLVQPLK